MKRNLLLSSIFLMGSVAFSQNYLKADYIKTKSTDEQGVIKFVSFKANANISRSEAGLLLKETLGLNGNNRLILQKSENDPFGGTHEFYKQFYNNTEVAHSSYRVHSRNGIITSVNGQFNPISLQTPASELKTAAQIFQTGLSKLGSNYALPQDFQGLTPKSKLVVLPKSMSNINSDRYAYQFTVISQNPGNVESVYMDAVNGEILKKEPLMIFHQQNGAGVLNKEQTEFVDKLKQKALSAKSFDKLLFDTGNAATRYSGLREIESEFNGTNYELKDDNRFVNTVNFNNQDYLLVALFMAFGSDPDDIVDMANKFTDDDNNWTAEEFSANKNDGGLEAHWAFKEAYDFLKEEYDRDGYDNQNSPVTAFIHTQFFGDGRNAAWMALEDLGYQGGFMFVGDGDYNPADGSGQFDILAGLDAISHEFAHGITNAASGLVYQRESGALNEGFSDIWAAAIEAKKAPEKEKWAIGEDFVMVGPGGLRSLENPKLFGQPDTYMGTNWTDASDGCTPSADNDNCGVHINSGVLNHWFYLTVEGGSGVNDNAYEFEFEGMGMKKAADLVYSVQMSYLQSESKFSDVRDYTLQEAVVMYGEDSAEALTVQQAWCAVGVSTGEECELLAVKDQSLSAFSIFPNPVKDILNVRTENTGRKVSYSINNLSGQKLMQAELVDSKINVAVLPAGVYVLTVNDGAKTQNFKFVKK